MNSWSNALLTTSVCFFADFDVVTGWARDLFAGGSDDIPAWKTATVGLLLVIQSGLVVVAAAEEPTPLSPCGVGFFDFFERPILDLFGGTPAQFEDHSAVI